MPRKMSFIEWIDKTGMDKIAKKLGTTENCVRMWRDGVSHPKVIHMRVLKKMAKGAIGYDQIIDNEASRK